MLFQVIAISVSLSIDALGIGLSYKWKGIKINLSAKLIIGIISAIMMWISLKIGNLALTVLPPKVTQITGITILLIIGIAFIRNSLSQSETTYDFDRSMKIDFVEAIILGFVLSADSVSAGIAAATVGLDYIVIPVMVGIMQIIFLYLGDKLADKSNLVQKIGQKSCGILSGSLLILIAILRIFA